MLQTDGGNGDAFRHPFDRRAVGEARVAGLYGHELASILLGRSPTGRVPPKADADTHAYADRAVRALLRPVRQALARWFARVRRPPMALPNPPADRWGTMSDNLEAATPRSARLRQVADALGVPVETLMDEAASAPWREMTALLGAFPAITDAQGRRRIQALAQVETDRSLGKAGLCSPFATRCPPGLVGGRVSLEKGPDRRGAVGPMPQATFAAGLRAGMTEAVVAEKGA